VIPTVVTAIYGGSDSLWALPEGTHGIAYTDVNEPVGGWEIRYEPMVHLGDNPRLKAKFWKCFGHIASPDPVTLWIDGAIKLFPGWESIGEELGDDDAVFFRHHIRDCIYEEVPASFSGRLTAYEGQDLQRQVESYGLPPNAGLLASGCMIRRDTPTVRRFNELWWQEICRWSMQDQLSATPVIKMLEPELKWHYFSRLMIDQPWFGIYPHEGGT
jgi:Protein of unknown function (DUF616)